MATAKEVKEEKRIHYEWDGYNGKYRLWRANDPGDVFDMIQPENLPAILSFARREGYNTIEGMPEDA